MEFVLASHNAKKLTELREILSDSGIVVSALPAGAPEPVEDGGSFAENALIKARAACALTGKPALADDSGLCVTALGGAPGVYSARYGSAEDPARSAQSAGEPLPPDADDQARTQYLLRNMAAVPDGERQAQFVSVIACVFPDGREFTVQGTCAGEIARAPAGAGGFGYDPVFYLPAYGKTFAELAPAEKNSISHRGRALHALGARLSGASSRTE